MSSIVVRGLDEAVKSRLSALATERGQSMEAQVREILTLASTQPHIGLSLMRAAQEFGGIDDLPTPPRDDQARAVSFE